MTLPSSTFISYAHGTDEFNVNVRKLADSLNRDGIPCEIDQYVQAPSEGWPKWMTRQIAKADYVLVIASERFFDSYMGSPTGGKGVPFESTITLNELFDAKMVSDKYITILFSHRDAEFIIPPLQGYNYYDLSTDEGYELLVRRITRQPLIQKPATGVPKTLKPGKTLNSLFTIKEEAEDDNADVNSDSDTDVQVKTTSALFDVELHIDADPSKWTEENLRELMHFLNTALLITDVKVKGIRKGSIYLRLGISYNDCILLMDAVNKGKLRNYDVMGVRPIKGSVGAAFSEELTNLTEKEVSELAKILRDEYGIERGAAAVVPTDRDVEKSKAPILVDILLTYPGDDKNETINTIKYLTGLGLEDAFHLVHHTPAIIAQSMDRNTAEQIIKVLQALGARAEIV